MWHIVHTVCVGLACVGSALRLRKRHMQQGKRQDSEVNRTVAVLPAQYDAFWADNLKYTVLFYEYILHLGMVILLLLIPMPLVRSSLMQLHTSALPSQICQPPEPTVVLSTHISIGLLVEKIRSPFFSVPGRLIAPYLHMIRNGKVSYISA